MTAFQRPDAALLDRLEAAIHSELQANPAGLGEYELIRTLREHHPGLLAAGSLVEPLTLFRVHFTLFHVLYRLRDRLRSAGIAELLITPLDIRLTAPRPGEAALTDPDPLAAVYTDVSRLETITSSEVEDLLQHFWRAFATRDGRAAALQVLELQDPVDQATIKRQYRRLVMRHHPDRGGDSHRFRAIQQAMESLANPS